MRKSQSRRPALAVEGLEGRLVLTGGGSLTQELAAVAAAFKTFESTYAADVNATLFRPTFGIHGTTTNTAANRAAFNTDVTNALNTLVSKLDSAFSILPQQTNTTLSTAVSNNLLSSGSTNSNNLQAVLGHMATPTPGAFAAQKFINLSDLNINSAQAQLDAVITAQLKS